MYANHTLDIQSPPSVRWTYTPDTTGDITMSIYFPTSHIPNFSFLETPIKSATFDGIKTIGDYAFAATNLSGILTLNEVTDVGANAFLWCNNLTSVYLGSDYLKTIGENAFYAMEERWIANVYVARTSTPLPTVDRNSFSGEMTIYVPINKVSSYKRAWPDFASQIVGGIRATSPFSNDGVENVTEYNVTLNLSDYCTASNLSPTTLDTYSNVLTPANNFAFVRSGTRDVVYGGGGNEPEIGDEQITQSSIPITCTVEMGGDDITSSVFDSNTGEISIERVTADITVTVSALEQTAGK